MNYKIPSRERNIIWSRLYYGIAACYDEKTHTVLHIVQPVTQPGLASASSTVLGGDHLQCCSATFLYLERVSDNILCSDGRAPPQFLILHYQPPQPQPA